MKTTFLSVALVSSSAIFAQANPAGFHGGGKGFHGGATAHAAPAARAPAARAPVRTGGVSSFGSRPVRNFGGGMLFVVWNTFVPAHWISSVFDSSKSGDVYPFRSIHGSNDPATQSCRAIRESQKFSCHTVVEPAKQRNAVPEWKQSTERKQSAEWEQSAEREHFPKWKQSPPS